MESSTYSTVFVQKSKNTAVKFSSVLGFPVSNKIMIIACVADRNAKERWRKFEKLFEGKSLLEKKDLRSLNEQKELTEWGTSVERLKGIIGCHQVNRYCRYAMIFELLGMQINQST